MEEFDVIVIGAGAAGLAAARRLTQEGKKVVVLEARNRIGGRIHTIRENGVVVEAGAEFIHGRRAAHFEIVRAHDLPTEEWGKGLATAYTEFHESGAKRDDSDEIFKEMREIIAPMYDYEGADMSAAEYINSKAASEEVSFFTRRKTGDLEGDEAERIGLSALVAGSGEDDPTNFHLPHGYDQILEPLAVGLDIRFGHEVAGISWATDSVIVEISDGTRFKAQKTVITVPLGVLKSQSIEFSPRLPESFTTAISKIGWGDSGKLTLWITGSLPQFRIIDTKGAFGHFWARPFGERTVVVGFASGDRVRAYAELPEEDVIAQGIEDAVDAFGEEFRSRITHARYFSWTKDPFAQGGYSYAALGQGDARTVLKTPIENTLYFAGEAANDSGNAATVQGALISGNEAADSLLSSWHR